MLAQRARRCSSCEVRVVLIDAFVDVVDISEDSVAALVVFDVIVACWVFGCFFL